MQTFLLQIFSGNFDSSTPVTYYFTSPLHAQYLRILPQTWQGKIALRVEVIGCPVTYPSKFQKFLVTFSKTLILFVAMKYEKLISCFLVFFFTYSNNTATYP